MGHRGGSSAGSFFLCSLTHSCRRMGSCLGHSVEELNLQGLHLCAHWPVCPPHFLRSSAWSRRARAIPCSNAAHRRNDALTAERPFHVERSAFQRWLLYTARGGCASSRCSFSRPCRLYALSTSLKDAVHLWAQSDIFCDWATGALVFHPIQIPSRFQCCTVGGLSGNSKCCRGPHAWPCPGTHHRSGFPRAATPYRCTVAGSTFHTASSSGCSKSRTCDAWRGRRRTGRLRSR